MYTLGIDTGGTFTDAFITGDGSFATVKVETTPHDLTVCFADAVGASASAVGLERDAFLRQTDVIRFSSTIATNTVLTQTGPKLGLVVTAGARDTVYGAASSEFFEFIPPSMIGEITEEVSADGTVAVEPEVDEVNRVVRLLLEQGARLLVVSLQHASANASNEQAVKAAIDANYPRHYLGAVPVLLSTQISSTADDAARTVSAVVNAYVHKKLATSLYRAEDDIRANGFRRPLLVVTTDGGVTRVAKTRALSTYQSGPTSGIYASARLCDAAGISVALTADVGGTSTDIGLVIDGQPIRRDRVDVAGVAVLQRSVELLSFGIGGGSLARVVEGRLRVGPESAGAAPGPACFGLGGREPTPTDAWLVLGYLDPDFYLGGRKHIDPALAAAAIRDAVADPLGLSIEEAALAIEGTAEDAVAAGIETMLTRDEVRKHLGERRIDEIAVVGYGGGGGILIPGLAQRLGLSRVLLSRLSPVFSAFGVSSFDVRHRYEARVHANGIGLTGALAELMTLARADMRGEGFPDDAIGFAVDVSTDDGRALAEGLAPDALAEVELPSDERVVLALVAVCSVAKAGFPSETPAGATAAPKATRRIVLADGSHDVDVYERNRLGAGMSISGPALIEAVDTTYLVPQGMVCTIDQLGTAQLTEDN